MKNSKELSKTKALAVKLIYAAMNILKENGKTSALDDAAKIINDETKSKVGITEAKSILNRVKNWLKHAEDMGKFTPILEYDEELEAIQYLNRAVDNYRRLFLGIKPNYYKFLKHVKKSRCKELLENYDIDKIPIICGSVDDMVSKISKRHFAPKKKRNQ